MPTTSHDPSLEERFAELDHRLREVEAQLIPPPRRRAAVPLPARPRVAVPPPAPAPAPSPPVTGRSLGDLVGGRLLAWIGGAAILLGIMLFLVLAVSRGWIGVDARVGLAGTGSSLLMAAGAWLHARRGRTEASIVMVGTATAGLFATLIVAAEIYGLISPLVAVGGSMLVGALATALAVRWAGQAIAVIGLLGALISPILVGAPVDAVTVAILAVGGGCAMLTVVAQRWEWIGVATVVICAAQWGPWIIAGPPLLLQAAVLVWFAALGLGGAIGMQVRSPADDCRAVAGGLAALSACVVAVLGEIALRDAGGGHAGAMWLGALALVHATAGAGRLPGVRVNAGLRRMLMVLGLILADLAFGLVAGGIVLTVGWGTTAVGFAWLSRRSWPRTRDDLLVRLGLGAHIALTLIRALLDAPPGDLGSARPLALVSVATLAAGCLISASLVGARQRAVAVMLNSLGLAAVAYLTAQTLTGSALVVAWALEALALASIAAPGRDHVARWGALAFVSLAGLHAFIIEAPPTALVTGAHSLGAAGIALGAIALTLATTAARLPRGAVPRPWLLGGAAATLLYLGSVAVITVFQPAVGTAGGLLDLSVRQEGQVVLSACWSLVGLIGLIAGLRRDHALVRHVALGLLLVTVAKVFLYDLSALTSLYRVASFLALGVLLLTSAFAYQRLRPPPLPDLRRVPASRR